MSKTTENYGLTKPEVGEFFSLETWNENMDKIDGELKKREDAQKESDNSLMNPEFTEAKERKNLTSGEKIHLMLGKIARFFTDLKTVAFTGNYKDLSNKPTSLPASDVSAWAKAKTKPTYTKAEVGLGNVDNTADSAKSVKYATSAGNATKVNNHTVNADVPSGAKFTDTTYGVATTTKTGIVKPDGKTITADKDGTLHGADIDGITITRDDATKVIALAKTLQDKIGTIGNKVDKKNIVNNQTTTVAGFALDARQANPNIDGTLAKQLSDLNGRLGTFDFIPDGSNLNYYTSGVYMISNTDKLENSPDASWSILIAFGTNSIYSVQIVISVLDSQNSIYVRTKNERNEWCSWFKK